MNGELDTAVEREPLHPTQGGCWFCHKGGCDSFSWEFDTNLHLDCLKQALHANDAGEQTGEFERDPEVDIIADEFGLGSEA